MTAPGKDPPRPRQLGETPKLVQFGKYLLIERVAMGGMAEIWLAKVVGDESVSDLLAIKRILPHLSSDAEFVRMFVDEAKIAGALDHPGIARMRELGRIDHSYYIAMEYVWGRDLLAILKRAKERERPIPPVVVAYIGARVCEALFYAHTRINGRDEPLGLVHRDVSPQNVLLSFDGHVKVIDFGIAKATTRSSKTQAGTLKGKVGYMSPEQVRGLSIDARSDQFALGTCLYELLTARPLFMRGNNIEAMSRVRDADVPPLLERCPGCPPKLAAIVTRALAKERVARFGNLDEMRAALLTVLAEQRTNFERTDLAEWLRDLFKEEFASERSRLDAQDLIGRSPLTSDLKKHKNPATELQIGSVDLFEDEVDQPTEVWASPVLPRMEVHAGPYEVFFHRGGEDLVGLGAPPTTLLADGRPPLHATFRPGKAKAVEAWRPPKMDPGREGAAAPAPMTKRPPAPAPIARATPLEPPSEADVDATIDDGGLSASAFDGIELAIASALAPPVDVDVELAIASALAPPVDVEAPVEAPGTTLPEVSASPTAPAVASATVTSRVERSATRAPRAPRRADAAVWLALGAGLLLAVGAIGTYLVVNTPSAPAGWPRIP